MQVRAAELTAAVQEAIAVAHHLEQPRCRSGRFDLAVLAIAGEMPPPLVERSDAPHEWLAAAGFHRIGRIDAVGRRSLWLREERDAIDLRAGREGGDEHVRITAENPQYQQIRDVLSAARFAAEWEIEGGTALDASYALDVEPASVHRQEAP